MATKIGKPWSGYYLTAYGIAVKHGFDGTEEEWLESLKGGAAYLRYQDGYIQWKCGEDGEWTNLISVDSIVEDMIADADDSLYRLPEGGIPKTDLADAVKTSLGKADTAYQKPGSGIPPSALHESIQAAIDLANSAYQKPAGGIQKTDMDSEVQTSIGKAGTAVQTGESAELNSVSIKQNNAYQLHGEIKMEAGTVTYGENPVLLLKSAGYPDNMPVCVSGVANPTSDGDAVNKSYVDTQDAIALKKESQAAKTAGMTQAIGVDANGKLWALPPGTGSGDGGGSGSIGVQTELVLDGYSENAYDSVKLTTADIASSGTSTLMVEGVDKPGDVLVRGVAAPENDNDAANKEYTDAVAAGVAPMVVKLTGISTVVANKTLTQMNIAHAAGRTVMLIDENGRHYHLDWIYSSMAIFTSASWFNSEECFGIFTYIITSSSITFKYLDITGSYYTKAEIDAALGSYITNVAALVGGDA